MDTIVSGSVKESRDSQDCWTTENLEVKLPSPWFYRIPNSCLPEPIKSGRLEYVSCGENASVFLIHKNDECKYAVKIIHDGTDINFPAKEEVNVSLLMSDHNIGPKIFLFGECQGECGDGSSWFKINFHFIIMERMQTTLLSYMSELDLLKNGKIDETKIQSYEENIETIINTAVDLARSIWKLGYKSSDVHGGNLMFDLEHGKPLRVRWIDFETMVRVKEPMTKRDEEYIIDLLRNPPF